jgi:hypothetical protein
MRRVVRSRGTVTTCTWDYGSEMQMLRTFWDAALTLDPAAPDEVRVMGYTDPTSLRELWLRADLRDVETAALVVDAEYDDFDDYWQPFLTGTGPGGAYCGRSTPTIRRRCARNAPGGSGVRKDPSRSLPAPGRFVA